jgi:hypothetical protein
MLSKTFSADGRLLVTPQGEALLNLPDADQRAAFEAMPRALRQTDANHLAKTLSAAAGMPAADLRAAAVQARVPAEVLAFLFDDAGLRADRVRALPARQAASLTAAAGVVVAASPADAMDVVAPAPQADAPAAVARPDRRGRQSSAVRAGALAQAAQFLNAQATHRQAAEQTGLREGTAFIFDGNGRLLISRQDDACCA